MSIWYGVKILLIMKLFKCQVISSHVTNRCFFNILKNQIHYVHFKTSLQYNLQVHAKMKFWKSKKTSSIQQNYSLRRCFWKKGSFHWNTPNYHYTRKGKRKVQSATITNRSPSQTLRGRGNRQIQKSTNRTNVRKALRLVLSSPSEVIAMLKGLKKHKNKMTQGKT